MKSRYRLNQTNYDLITKVNTSCVVVEKDNDFLAFCWDREQSYKVVQEDIMKSFRLYKHLKQRDFKCMERRDNV